MHRIVLRNGVQKKIADGHPWVYRNQIDPASLLAAEEAVPAGGQADVYDFRQRYLGTGLFNPASMLTVRILARNHEVIDGTFIRDRVRKAVEYRKPWLNEDTNSCRLIFSEADLLPGVVADLFADTVVLQILALGMDPWQDVIAETLLETVCPANLILQNDEPVRKKENLPLYRLVYHGHDQAEVMIRENGLQLWVDLAGGQKTGYYLDQKANHAHLRPYCQGRNVLDCFCYNGGFALNAAAGGASCITGVDISASALALAARNAEANGLADQMNWVEANAFDFLRNAVQDRRHYDLIVLDPPAFAKSHAALPAARRGYKEINLSALRLLTAGGILVTHSCSFHMSEENFAETILSAAHDARRTIRIMDVRSQDGDHPVLAGYAESHYLKSFWLLVLE